MPNAHFSEDEIQHLFRRAAALQAQSEEGDPNRPGLSSEELEAIAEQAGIAPQYVRQAIAEYQHPAKEAEADQSTTHIFIEQQVDALLTDESWDGLVSYLRLRYDTDLGERLGVTDAGSNGYGKSTTEQIGSAKSWTHLSMMGVETRISAVPTGSQTNLMLSRRVGIGGPVIDAGLLGLLPAVIVFLSASQFMASSPALILSILMFACAMALTFHIGGRWRQRQAEELTELAENLSTRLAMGTTSPSQQPSSQQPAETERLAAEERLSPDAFEEASPVTDPTRAAERLRSRE